MKTVWLFILIIKTILEITEAGDSIVSTNDKEPDQISLFIDTKQHLNITDNDKPILRYGFQKTQDCRVFEKAFLCIRKCLDLGYEIAHADKLCLCTCKRNRDIAKHKKPYFGPTKWQMGVPTTSLPPWAKKQSHTKLSMKEPINDFEIYGDVPFPDDQQINVTESVNTKNNIDERSTPGKDNKHKTISTPVDLETTTVPDPTKEKDATNAPESNESRSKTIPPDADNEQNTTIALDSNNATDHNEVKDAPTESDPSEGKDATTAPDQNAASK